MLKSEESNRKKLEEREDLYKKAELTTSWYEMEEEEEDRKLIDNIKSVYKIEDDDFKIISMPQFIFAKRFRNILKDWHLKGEEAESFLDMSKATISRYKNGDEYPGTDTILKLAKKFHVTPYYFWGLSNHTTIEAELINEMLGLSEKAMKNLFMLQHNVPECEELTDNVPISNQNRRKLNILNFLIEDNINFLKFLRYIEYYVELKEKMQRDMDINKDDIKSQLLGLKGELISMLLETLKNIKIRR